MAEESKIASDKAPSSKRPCCEIAFIFDLDGVLSDNSSRQHLLSQEGKTKTECWKEFYEASAEDAPFEETLWLAKHLQAIGAKILLVTGRSEEYEDLLDWWLEENHFFPDKIYQRQRYDFRKDWEVKQEHLMSITKSYKILGVFEDRLDCVKMYRSFGLTCYQPRESSY